MSCKNCIHFPTCQQIGISQKWDKNMPPNTIDKQMPLACTNFKPFPISTQEEGQMPTSKAHSSVNNIIYILKEENL